QRPTGGGSRASLPGGPGHHGAPTRPGSSRHGPDSPDDRGVAPGGRRPGRDREEIDFLLGTQALIGAGQVNGSIVICSSPGGSGKPQAGKAAGTNNAPATNSAGRKSLTWER